MYASGSFLRPFFFAGSMLGVVGGRRDLSASTGPVGMKELSPRLVDTLVGVRTEEVALRLQQVRRQASGAIAVVEGKRGGESRGWARRAGWRG